MQTYKLGKLAPKHDPRSLRLEAYLPLRANMPPIPASFDYGAGIQFPMWLNDRIGDCTCASSAGLILAWTSKAGSAKVVSDDDVLNLYERVSGYNPATGANDNGAVILDVLKEWKNGGLGGDHLGAYGDVGNASLTTIFAATYLCEGLTIGLQLPEYCLNPTVSFWDAPSRNIAGGHDVILLGADGQGNAIVYTWGGQKKTLSPRFIGAQVDELHFGFSTDQLNGQGLAAAGIDLASLQADLASIGQFETPPLVVTPPPHPNPPPPASESTITLSASLTAGTYSVTPAK